jgi:carbon-monoxide dehydrogenase catalytic subunit
MNQDDLQWTADPAARMMLTKARENNIETAWDRFEAMQDVCAFGDLGLCCRNCLMGPCRIDPFGEGPSKGICGISADGMVARNLCRSIAAGASAHADHGAHILEVFERVAEKGSKSFRIKDEGKLKTLAASMGVEQTDGDALGAAKSMIPILRKAYSGFGPGVEWLEKVLPKARLEKLRAINVLPSGIDPTIRETMHRTHMGVDADPVNLLLGAIKCALSDFIGMDVASNVSDVLLGTPNLAFSEANLGVLKADAVNVAVHGHHPLISESILAAAPDFQRKAIDAGAAAGINVVGVCCTGNEVLLRHGIPLATNAASQELVVLTGAADAMVVDVQCVMPSLSNLCECYHTKLITTMSIAKIPGATHVEFDPHSASESAKQILELAVEAFKNRDPKKVDIPQIKRETCVGFSVESILSVLRKVNSEDPLKPLVDSIADGSIMGVVLFAGCNNYKVPQDSSFIALAEKLARDNVLLLATGCAAGAFAKRGFLSPSAVEEICGDSLKKVLSDLGGAAGLDRPLPPVWHMGSCVDNSRAVRLAFALADRLGVDVDKIPVVASAPEAMSEKSISIGTGAVALGITTHIGVVPPVLGGKVVTKVLTETAQDLFGARFIVEPDPVAAYQRIRETLLEKRAKLGFA